MTIGERIRKLREERGITGEELARRVNVTSSYIYQLERGKTLPYMTAKRVAEVLGCTLEDLDPESEKNRPERAAGID